MKINLGKILHIAVQVAPHVIPIVGLVQSAVAVGKAASKSHDKLTLGEAAVLAGELTGAGGV